MWSRKDKDGDIILVATHVDDSTVTGSDDDKTDTFVREMLERFDGTCELNLTEMLCMEWETKGLDLISATPTLSCQSLCNPQGKSIWTRSNTA